MRRGSPGSSIWAASSYTRTRYVQTTWITRTNCGSISIQAQASVGRMCALSPSRWSRFSMRWAFAVGPKPAVHAEYT
jgi:hypothetical protein